VVHTPRISRMNTRFTERVSARAPSCDGRLGSKFSKWQAATGEEAFAGLAE
jgi:hypothetical protein